MRGVLLPRRRAPPGRGQGERGDPRRERLLPVHPASEQGSLAGRLICCRPVFMRIIGFFFFIALGFIAIVGFSFVFFLIRELHTLRVDTHHSILVSQALDLHRLLEIKTG